MDGVEDGGSGDQFLIVHVSAVHPGRGGVDLASGGRGYAPMGAEEGVEGDGDAGGEGSGPSAVAVEEDEAGSGV